MKHVVFSVVRILGVLAMSTFFATTQKSRPVTGLTDLVYQMDC